MIRHVVMWKMRGPSVEEKQAQAARLRAALEGLRGKIEGMSQLEVGISVAPPDEQISDVVLVTTHDSWDALKAYAVHPEHLEVVKLAGQIRSERRAVDFEVP